MHFRHGSHAKSVKLVKHIERSDPKCAIFARASGVVVLAKLGAKVQEVGDAQFAGNK